jgi:hypothetical protein
LKRDFGVEDVNLAGSIDRLQLQNAVDRLAPGYRAIFTLYDVEGYEHHEIATMVAFSIGSSKITVAQGKNEVRGFLKMHRAEKGRKILREQARGAVRDCGSTNFMLGRKASPIRCNSKLVTDRTVLPTPTAHVPGCA